MNKLFGQKAFEKQALNHLDSLYFAALKLTGHHEDAEDLVQETYRKAFHHLHQLRDPEKCRPWLYRIMINTWKNLITKRSREFFPASLEEWEGSMTQYANVSPQSHRMDPEAEVIHKELWKAVESETLKDFLIKRFPNLWSGPWARSCPDCPEQGVFSLAY
jgi:RNA polymerase sigma factor (sigma-70 family)